MKLLSGDMEGRSKMDIRKMANSLKERLLKEGTTTSESCGYLPREDIMALSDKKVIEIYITRPRVCAGPMIPYNEALSIISNCNSVEEFCDYLNIIARKIRAVL